MNRKNNVISLSIWRWRHGSNQYCLLALDKEEQQYFSVLLSFMIVWLVGNHSTVSFYFILIREQIFK